MNTYHTGGEISAEVKRRLETRTIALGAETDIGRKVYLGKRDISAALVPCCSIIEGDDIPARGNARTDYLIDQRFAVLAYVECDDEDPNVAAHAAVRDIKRAVFTTDGKSDPDLGKRAAKTTYLGRQIAARAAGEKFILVVVEFSVEYVENVATP